MPERPGGALARRPLHMVWLVDCSGSMAGKKIESLNLAIRESIKPTQDVADANPNAEVLVRAIKFSAGAQWHVSQATDIHQFKWSDLSANGETAMGKALSLLADAMTLEKMPPRGLPPVLLLISDGQPTDDFSAGLKALMAQPWGQKAVRISIAIGDDADLDVLQRFMGNTESKPLVASNVQDLVTKIKWASTVAVQAASNPAGKAPTQMQPQNTPAVTATDVF